MATRPAPALHTFPANSQTRLKTLKNIKDSPAALNHQLESLEGQKILADGRPQKPLIVCTSEDDEL